MREEMSGERRSQSELEFDGCNDEVRYFDGEVINPVAFAIALSAEEIAALYDFSRPVRIKDREFHLILGDAEIER